MWVDSSALPLAPARAVSGTRPLQEKRTVLWAAGTIQPRFKPLPLSRAQAGMELRYGTWAVTLIQA